MTVKRTKEPLNVVLDFLQEVQKKTQSINDYFLSDDGYGLTRQEFGDLITLCQEKGFIRDAIVKRGSQKNVLYASADNARITFEGMEYISKNYKKNKIPIKLNNVLTFLVPIINIIKDFIIK